MYFIYRPTQTILNIGRSRYFPKSAVLGGAQKITQFHNYTGQNTYCRSSIHTNTASGISGQRLIFYSNYSLPLLKQTFSTSKFHTSVCHNSDISQKCTSQKMSGTELGTVVSAIKSHAPTSLAEGWDNVGLLVEPTLPHFVKNILLTNDLTPPVMDEALEKKADLILSYHPPLFSSIKRLTQGKWKDRLIIKCIENRIAVYSPHTCYDAKAAGVNDWLISAFETADVVPVQYTEACPTTYSHKVNLLVPQPAKLQEHLTKLDLKITSSIPVNSKGDNLTLCAILCNKSMLIKIMEAAKDCGCDVDTIETIKLEKTPVPGYGGGRVATLKEPISLQDAVIAVKKHLKLDHVRLAAKPGNKNIKSVAVCAGSGSSVLRGVKADLYVTGEMSHHEVLDAVYNGSNVILCEHSNTERGFLQQIQQELSALLTDVSVMVSSVDTDPLKVV